MLKAIRSSIYTQEQLEKMSREEIIEGMTDREVAFSEYYVTDLNPYMSAIKAGFKVQKNKSIPNSIRNRQHVVDYIAWLKIRTCQKACVSAVDILNSYAKMAYYDIKDYVVKEGNKIKLANFDMIDGQIIQEITQNANGSINVKFPDRIKAFEKLENYMDCNPYDWKRKMEERKLQIMEDKMQIEKSKAGLDEEIIDDGFIEALEKSAAGIFDDEEEE